MLVHVILLEVQGHGPMSNKQRGKVWTGSSFSWVDEPTATLGKPLLLVDIPLAKGIKKAYKDATIKQSEQI